eukprot:CAMPEP_0170150728 /NCGR_PEP_ID=MMETSP0033_2-20121228/47393_1 /TAXON_ID=195969 /ORGANISM="Dolichomastix tenuilepis, Strain CCMP3274" /LENGTH=177 /DNA_ID=CAMNT_0010387781 /DNA_START=32 /DNA_END=562 /DNA_ORIENTATION=+
MSSLRVLAAIRERKMWRVVIETMNRRLLFKREAQVIHHVATTYQDEQATGKHHHRHHRHKFDVGQDEHKGEHAVDLLHVKDGHDDGAFKGEVDDKVREVVAEMFDQERALREAEMLGTQQPMVPIGLPVHLANNPFGDLASTPRPAVISRDDPRMQTSWDIEAAREAALANASHGAH